MEGPDEKPASPLAERHPSLAWWTANQGWIEIGWDGMRPAFVRAVDEGGSYWEGERNYLTLEDAFVALDAGIRAMIEEMGLG